MSQPYNVVPSFANVFLTANQVVGGGVWSTIVFDVVNTDGSNPLIYNPATGYFTAPVSGWYDVNVLLQSVATLPGVRIVKNGDSNFPVIGLVPSSTIVPLGTRVQLGLGETLRIDVLGAGTVLALSGLVPNTRASTCLFSLVKRYEDTKIF